MTETLRTLGRWTIEVIKRWDRAASFPTLPLLGDRAHIRLVQPLPAIWKGFRAKHPECSFMDMGDLVTFYPREKTEAVVTFLCDAGLEPFRRPADLEDVFLQLTGREIRE